MPRNCSANLNSWNQRPKQGRSFSDYDSALRQSGADIVYLSLPNAMHEQWAMAALAVVTMPASPAALRFFVG